MRVVVSVERHNDGDCRMLLESPSIWVERGHLNHLTVRQYATAACRCGHYIERRARTEASQKTGRGLLGRIIPLGMTVLTPGVRIRVPRNP